MNGSSTGCHSTSPMKRLFQPVVHTDRRLYRHARQAIRLYEYGGGLKSGEDLCRCLEAFVGKEICFKLVEGSNGKGFRAYRLLRRMGELCAEHLSTMAVCTVRELYDNLMQESVDGWLLEEYIVQHPVLKSFNPSSLNTIRMFLYKSRMVRL